MKKTFRIGVWETNSSSVHSMCMCTKDEFEKFQKGELVYYEGVDKLINPKEIDVDGDYGVYDYSNYWKYCKPDGCEGYIESYVTPTGDEIVAFGYFGFDY